MSARVAKIVADRRAFPAGVVLGTVILLALACFPFVSNSYYTQFVTGVMILAIFAMSLDLLLGYTGQLSFGSAAFFGLAAYTVILLGLHFELNAWLALLVSVIVALLAAVVIGYFCTRVSGIPFFMLTMAFAQLLFSVAMKWRELTNGSDGLGGIVRPSIFGWSLDEPRVMYFFVLFAGLMSFLFLRLLLSSPLGHAFVGIRENELRMRAIGYPTQRYRLLAFAISGAVAGFSGGLSAIFHNFVSPDTMHWALSAEVLVMVILGGAGTLIGPIIGAATFATLKHFISSSTQHWNLIVGAVFIACVLFFPQGIYGALRSIFRKRP